MKGDRYILRSVDGSYYTGSTNNIELRLQQHQDGLGARHTAKRLSVELVYLEIFERVERAFRREKQVQGWSRKKKEALMVGDSNQLHELAVCRNETHCSNVGFSSAQPARGGAESGFGSAQPSGDGTTCSLSGVEGKGE